LLISKNAVEHENGDHQGFADVDGASVGMAVTQIKLFDLQCRSESK